MRSLHTTIIFACLVAMVPNNAQKLQKEELDKLRNQRVAKN